METTVLLVDDHPVFRKGLRLLLEGEQDIRVVGEAGDGRAAIDLLRELSPDVVVMDITMPHLNGIDATRQIVSESPNAKVVALSIHSGKRFVEDMLSAGAAGYLLKESAPEELVEGIRAVMRGEVCLSTAITGVVVSQYVDVLSRAQASGEHAELTARERETLQLVAEGRSTKQIASVLKVSTKTVENTQRRVMKKLGVNTVAELTEIARHGGLIEEPGQYAPAVETSAGPIVSTKLHRPPLTSDIISRERLLKLLNEGRQRPATLVSAAAGYGKSTLASSWLEACDCPSAWVSLDEDDNDVRSFLSYVLAAIQTAFPESGRATKALLEAPDVPPGSVLARYLLNDLDQIDDPFILVLDDYYLIHERAVHDLLTELLHHPPDSMHLVLLTRRDPPLPISTLRARGYVTEIGVEQLRFTVAETTAFLENVLRQPVDESTAAFIDEKLEGWVTGLRLAALSLRDRKDLDHIVSGLEGGFHYITDYLTREVLLRQSPTIATYLMETSILDRFCAPLCEAVHSSKEGRAGDEIGGQEFIEWLEEANLFVISLDEQRCWFRYHHLFQQLLQDQLRQHRSSEDIATLHSRASEWLAKSRRIDDAIQHALAAGDEVGAAQLVEQNRQAVLNDDRWYVFEKWLSMLPDTVIQRRPGLLMARAWVLYHHFDIPAIPSVIDTVESLLSDASADQPLRGEIDFFRGYIHYFQNEGSRSLKHLQDALKRVPETYHEIRGQTEVLYGLASQMQGEKEAALNTLNALLYHHGPVQSVRRTRLLVTFVYIHIISGDLDEALVANQQLYDFATKTHDEYARVWSLYLRGLIHFYRNDLEETIGCFRQAVEQRYISHARAAVDSMAGLAFSYQATRQPDEAGETMQLLSEYVASLNEPAYTVIARSCGARLSIMQGQLRPGWLRGSPPPIENMVWWLEIPSVTHCRALLAKGSDENLHKAETRLRELLQLNEDNHNTLQMIEVMSLLALAYKKQERTDEALEILGRACDLAEPGGIIRPFVELGPPMADLLNRVKEQGVAADYILEILAAFEKAVLGVAPGASDVQRPLQAPLSAQPLVEPLSKRELAVLSLLAQGLSNKEIADKLFLAPETIKKHLYNTYQKLNVHSRTEALAKARELGILSLG